MKTNKRNKSILFLLLIFIAIISISIGYCTIGDIKINIDGTAKAEMTPILYIDNIEIDNNESTEGVSYASYTSEGTLLQISSLTLPKDNVTKDTNITILVHLNNLSDVTYKFAGTTHLTSADLADFPAFSVVNSNENIKIDETSYKDLIDTLIDAKTIDGIGTMTIPIKFKYIDIDNITDNTLDISIKLNFEKFERQTYKLKTGRDFYTAISSHYSDATKILFCAKTEVPNGATSIGEAGLTD